MNYLKEMAKQGYNPDSIGSFHTKMIPYLAKTLRIGLQDFILDIGAAQGHCVIPLSQVGYNNIAIVDIDTYNFRLFETRYKFTCYECDVEHRPIPVANETVTWVINFHLIEHLKEPHHLLSEVHRILKPGGRLSLVTPDWRKQYKIFYRDPTHVRPYDKESIARLLMMYEFKNVWIYSWGSAYGLGRLKTYRWFPRLGMIGKDILALGFKE
jgi:SAM-dependent methyltransferase